MIFSTVKGNFETVGRTYASSWAELDKLTAFWTGPSSTIDSAPNIGATHPTYPTLECNARRKISDVAGMVKLELEYVGLFSGAQTGPVVTESHWSESELEYQTPYGPTLLDYSATPNYGTDPGSGNQIVISTTVTVTYRYWALSTIIRYLAKSVSVRYVAFKPYSNSNIPGPSPSAGLTTLATQPGGTAQSVQVSNSATFQASTSGSLSPPSGASLALYLGTGPWGFHSEAYMDNFETEAISPNWYKCRANFIERYFAGKASR